MSINIGIICPSEIAFRRFLPSLSRVKEFSFAGVAIASPEEWAGSEKVTKQTLITLGKEREKANKITETFGGKVFEGYSSMISSNSIDVIYLPLPPALHYRWAMATIESGKHAFVEKPFTTCTEDTLSLLSKAKERCLAVHENYMFIYHQQLQSIQEIIASGEIGKVRQYRLSFGFPRRTANDFRYKKSLGGGALFDAGGYCMKYGSYLLGATARIICASSYYEPDFEVDIFGSATMINETGTILQLSFGMDCDYKCELEAWGSTGTLTTGRILTAPDGFTPSMTIKHNQDLESRDLPSDVAFEKSIRHFYNCITNENIREENYKQIEHQSRLTQDFIKLSTNGK